MKRSLLILVFLFVGMSFTEAHNDDKERKAIVSKHPGKDSSVNEKYLRIGIIPYQLLSRSSGAYIGYERKRMNLEFRLTYTYATKNLGLAYFVNILHDRFFYQGINNTGIISFHTKRNWNWGLLVGFRYWWYRNQWIPVDGTSTSSNYSFMERKSGTMFGPMIGFQMEKQFKGNKIDGAFFINFSETYFVGSATGYESEYPGLGWQYPYTSRISLSSFNLAIGFKIGYKKSIKNSE